MMMVTEKEIITGKLKNDMYSFVFVCLNEGASETISSFLKQKTKKQFDICIFYNNFQALLNVQNIIHMELICFVIF